MGYNAGICGSCQFPPLTGDDSVASRLYRIAPELRRSAFYAMVGFALLAVLAYWLGRALLDREPWPIAVCCSIFAAISLAMIVPLRWAVYVDGSGVARRWLVGWDLWSW